MTVREKMIKMMDALLLSAERISQNENAKPEEIALLPALASAMVEITAYAVIEKKD